MTSENINRPADVSESRLSSCPNCHAATVCCSQVCQEAATPGASDTCSGGTFVEGLRLVVERDEASDIDEEDDDSEEDDDPEEYPEEDYSEVFSEDSWLKNLGVKIESAEGAIVGRVAIQLIYPARTDGDGFFDCLDEMSRELSQFALLFDDYGDLQSNVAHAGTRCWKARDFDEDGVLMYVASLIIEEKWRGRGVGTWALPRLFLLNELKHARFMFTWPTVLNHLEPTPQEEVAWVMKQNRIIKFYRAVGFRRVGHSDFFCYAKLPSHGSRAIPADADAEYQEPPPPRTEAEMYRRRLANGF
ncbi:hypothetical protein JAAARDRAFT_205307 [Jaapia argillacea MUCL 33604]|uniref:N-acetyltransferase domain-containing protein n=1 Tax=Jaapia argillacea MUCL 33604 TaxID=933084 RepID=A0A067Q9Z9_9AGAM|nr:hypothetical protein JAAARDRAFT_205307 [Jaapia argillacea MUCL 33604]